jgi:AraC-like DNA-binding protein/mannose-6-phosphate isomerase-like protein (cupin superfamily)
MYKIKESESLLNRYAFLLPSNGITFRVHYWGMDMQHYDNPIHKHSFFEVCYVLRGEGTYMDQENIFNLRGGTLFCSRPGIIHQIRSEHGLELLFVAFEVDESKSTMEEADKFREIAEDCEVCVYEAEGSPTASLWRALLQPERELPGLTPELLPMAANLLIQSFIPLFSKRHASTGDKVNRSNLLLQRAKLYIRDNLNQPLSLEHIATYLHVSQRHLSRLFAEGIHESFGNFVRLERIHQAAHLLRTTELSIKEIAEETGFSSVHAFTRTFSKEKHRPPGRYRRG